MRSLHSSSLSSPFTIISSIAECHFDLLLLFYVHICISSYYIIALDLCLILWRTLCFCHFKALIEVHCSNPSYQLSILLSSLDNFHFASTLQCLGASSFVWQRVKLSPALLWLPSGRECDKLKTHWNIKIVCWVENIIS